MGKGGNFAVHSWCVIHSTRARQINFTGTTDDADAADTGGIHKFVLSKGYVISPPNLVTQSMQNVLSTLPSSFTPPKIITVSTTGLTKSSHSSLPLPLKPLYTYALKGPHQDKVGAEKIIAYCAGWSWDDGKVKDDILGKGEEWKEELPKPGTLTSVVVIRPLLFTDGECKADKLAGKDGKGKGKAKEPYRVQEGHISGYTISRKDVAHFVVEGVLADWQKWEGKCVGIAY